MNVNISLRIPDAQRIALLKRLRIVWCVALVIALMQWAVTDYSLERLKTSLVYSYAISTLCWFFCDPCRYLIRGTREQDGYNVPFMLIGCLLGYVLGTGVGDWYTGRSTLDLWAMAPAKFAGLLLGSMAISAAFAAYFFQRIKAERMEREYTEAQLRLLHSQLQPHMLFNAMANLRVLISQDVVKAQAMLDQLTDFLRASLQASRQTHHSLQQEFAFLADYLGLMQVRMGRRLVFCFNMPGELAHLQIPSLILQPLVENSIRHGLDPLVEGGTVQIGAYIAGNHLCLRVQDNGAGFQHAAAQAASFGLSQVRQRLHTLYSMQAALEIYSPPQGGACVTVKIPSRALS